MSLLKTAKEHGITPSSRVENRELFQQIAAGSPQAKQRLMEGNMAYVVNKVDRFLDEIQGFNHLRDDLISQGFLVLARIAQKVEKDGVVAEKDFAPQGLMSRALRNDFLKMVYGERQVPLTEAVAETLLYDTEDERDLKLDILTCCENEVETEIVNLRCEGLVDHQIAGRLGISERYVGVLRQKIHRKLQEA
jgi:DNA-directed RNA polymerase specialized sigma subunit